MGRIIPTCRPVLLGPVLALTAIPATAQVTRQDRAISTYVSARVAEGDGAAVQAAKGYAAALDAAPANAIVALRAYREALRVGYDALADRAEAVLSAADALPPEAGLMMLARAARTRDRAGADAAIALLDRGPLRILAPSLRAWRAFDADRDPFAGLALPSRDAVTSRFAGETRALLLIATGREAEGVTAIRAMAGTGAAALDLRISAAQLLIGLGKRKLAMPLLVGDRPEVVALRAPDSRGVKPLLAFGASRLFSRVASDLAPGEPGPLSTALARAALRADPNDDRARLLLAETLARSGASSLALTTLDAVPANSVFAAHAAADRIAILTDVGDRDRALNAARALAERPDATSRDRQRVGDILVASQRYDEAVVLFEQLVAGPAATDWTAWLQLGGALDEAGRWDEAEPALERAVQLAPDQPVALNYLGYARIAHGENLADAQAMLERASRINPDSAAITDSLGWAYFLRGQTARALPLLERASIGAPDDPTIGEHLGDAYWTLGRRYEARYAWRAAQLLADAGETARLTGKIANGLPMARR